MKKIILNFPAFFFCSLIFGQINLSVSDIESLDSITTQYVSDNAPGMATAIISNGKLIYKKCSGFENLDDKSKIDMNSRFNIASNGKQFTALAILLLENQGKINLSDDIRMYFPELYQKIDDKITIQNLLNHTSGIRDVYDLWSLQGITWWQQTYDNKAVMELIKKQKDLNFSPGSSYLYSNSNYIILSEIVSKVTNKSFVEFTQEIFEKLDMNHTGFQNDYNAINGPVARAYFNFDTWSTYDWKWNVVGDGNLFSTLSDQIQWEKIIQGYGKSKFPKDIITKSQYLTGTPKNFNYGYGLEFGKYKGISYRFHEGSTGAWKATVVRFENENTSIITLTNSGRITPSQQTRQMADIIFDLKSTTGEFITKPKKVGEYVSEDEILGFYLTPNNFSFEFKKNNSGSIVLNRIGRGEIELVREEDNIFYQKYDPAFKLEFMKNSNGEMAVTVYYTTHSPYTLIKNSSNWENYNYQMLNGFYENQETGVEFYLEYDSNKSYKVSINGEESTGVLVTPNKFLVNNYVIEFSIENGRVSSFKLNADRIMKVHFKRTQRKK